MKSKDILEKTSFLAFNEFGDEPIFLIE